MAARSEAVIDRESALRRSAWIHVAREIRKIPKYIGSVRIGAPVTETRAPAPRLWPVELGSRKLFGSQ